MASLNYVALRLVRRHLPNRLVRLLLARGIIIKPGLETSAPGEATLLFLNAVAAAGETVVGRRILIFGYGGNFGVALGLLQAGARHVVLVDPYAEPQEVPDPRRLTAIHAPLRDYLSAGGELVDVVLSNSMLEHVEDVAEAVSDLARATASGGRHFHFIDLRDHYFKYPFEMLCHSERIWRRVLNPGSNLNRLRVGDYERLFSTSFQQVRVELLGIDTAAFRSARRRIRPEFLTGETIKTQSHASCSEHPYCRPIGDPGTLQSQCCTLRFKIASSVSR
ncbi:MAG: methyltransferase domain-containing protein [Gemmatimonadales bacterium]|nr:methyltransferase domain-containing protein [Gemmatimonadales bacterium]